jgi:hypothetical protein
VPNEASKITLNEVERRLGFRVGRSGVERLTFSEDPDIRGIPKAVQPNLNRDDALALWGVLEEVVKTLDLRERDVRFWKDKSFTEFERGLKEAGEHRQAVDAHAVKDSLGTPKDE